MRSVMRFLSVKLTLAFLLVGLTGSVIVALAVQWQTQQAFDRFVLSNYERQFLAELIAYYEAHGSWEGVQALAVLRSSRETDVYRLPPVTIVDTDGYVVVGRPDLLGRRLTFNVREAIVLRYNQQTIGWMLLYRPNERWQPDTPEGNFISSLRRSILASALAATGLALIIGLLLARAIARPVRELREATTMVAGGDLGVQVPVRTDDEVGQLAASFNQMSADLAHANDLRQQMTADIAHDLRTPLSVILGYTEALSERKLEASPETYEVMHEEARRLQRLIDDLRILSLADAGELPLTKRPVHIRPLLDQVVASHLPRAEDKSILLEVESESDLPAVEMDPDRIAQVLGNLLNNALRHTPGGGRIVVSGGRSAAGVAIRVTDSGEGIQPEDLPHIFERSFRAESSRHTEDLESGLGLAIARSLIEAHGGTLTAASQPGVRTTFTIELPA